jgi:fibronectin-binding autotransporter adhesin
LGYSGTGTLFLASGNTFTGGVTLNGGTLGISGGSSLGATPGSPTTQLTFAGNSTLQFEANVTSGSALNLNRSIQINSGITGTVDTQTYTDWADNQWNGSGSVTKIGTGTLVLEGSDSFTGGLTLSVGSLGIDSSNALGTGTFTIAAGTTIDNLNGSLVTNSNNNAQIWNGSFTFVGSSSLNLGTGSVTLGASPTVTVSANTLTVGGVITGSGDSLTKAGAGTLVLSGINTYSGSTSVTGGVLSISADNNLGADPGSTTAGNLVLNGGTLAVSASFTLNSNRGIALGPTSGTGSGTITVASTDTLTYNGIIANNSSGTGTLVVNGPGALVLGGGNTFTGGVVLNSGTLGISAGSGLGTAPGTPTGQLTFAGNSTLQFEANIASGSALNVNRSFLINSGVTATVDTQTFTDWANNQWNGSGSVTKIGTGTLVLEGIDSFSGGMTLSAGELGIDSATALGTGTFTITGGTTIDNLSTGLVTNTNNNAQIWNGSFTFVGTQALNLGTGSVTLGASPTVTVNANALVVGGVITGTGDSLTKAGAGTLVLSGSNTYSGGTAVSAGTLLASNTGGSATGTGSLTVNAGGTIGGYGTTSGTGFSISGASTSNRANVLVGINSAADTNTTQSLTLIGSGASTIANANLTFNISATTAGQGTELSVGSTAIAFGAGTQSTTFSLNIQNEPAIIGANTAYVLVAGTNGGADQYSGLSLGASTGSLATGLTTAILNSGVGQSGNLTLALIGVDDTYYGGGSYLFLYQNSTTGVDDIEVEVVPEPGTWALMVGGLVMLVAWQRRKSKS